MEWNFSETAVNRLRDQRYNSYWERPENIANHYEAIQAEPGRDWASLGIDADWVTQQYETLRGANGGKNWWEWDRLADDDPYRDYLRSAPEPAQEIQWNAPYRPQQQLQLAQPATPQLPTGTDINDVTGWQRFFAFMTSNGTLSGIMNMMPYSVAGAVAGFVGGNVPGAIVGGISPLVAGAILGVGGDPENQKWARQKWIAAGRKPETFDALSNLYNQGMNLLNLPAEWTEQGTGAVEDIYNAAKPAFPYLLTQNPEMYDEYIKANADVKYLYENLGDLFEANKLNYDIDPTTPGVMSNLVSVPAGIEWALDMLSQGVSDVQFAKPGEVYTLTGAPEKLDLVGSALKSAVFKRINAGENPEQVLAEYQDMLAFSGQFSDLIQQSAKDPYLLAGIFERGLLGAAGIPKVIDPD